MYAYINVRFSLLKKNNTVYTVLKLQLAYYGILEPKLLKLILRVTETARQETQRIVQVNQHLYITYTHLVCRTALPGYIYNTILQRLHLF